MATSEEELSCLSKHWFGTKKEAKRKAKKSDIPLEVYKCRHCAGYHITSPKTAEYKRYYRERGMSS